MSGSTTHTPLIQQYLDIKARHPDAILFFRVGDFYEMFFDDAEEGSRLLGITLTSRNNGAAAEVPLAGVPVKALGDYLPRLVREGRKVAICEQVEDAAEAEGLVRREVTEIVTPGANLEESLLDEGRNNFVAALAGDDPVGLAVADLSTGELDLRECDAAALADELARLDPSEIVMEPARQVTEGRWLVTRREAWRFDPGVGAETLGRHYGVASTEGLGLQPERDPHLVAAAGAVLGYLSEVRPAGVGHLRPPRIHRRGGQLHVDEMTRRNLELVEPLRAGEGGTLIEVLDRTLTPMGRRLLRQRLLHPLSEREAIETRLDAVQELFDERRTRRSLRDALSGVRDLERLAARIAAERAGPRELLGLARSLRPLGEIRSAASSLSTARLAALVSDLDPLDDLLQRIESAVDDDAPPTLSAGGVIRRGHSEELDALRETRDGAVDWIARLQAEERARTGIESLKVGYNRVFGYYIEVTRPNLDRVPERYQRKQTLSNAERFFTPELKEWEARVMDADDRIAELEVRLFRELREGLAADVGRLLLTAEQVAELDVHAALAETAERNAYVRPEITTDYVLEIQASRHPVVERTIAREDFIPNDVLLDPDMYVMVLTGPNMAGKSTLLRQVGLAVVMAQIGSFVPANRARIGICDRLFTRVGASDSLARGQSTFMVEMTETATILNGATDRSLVLLDEIGRGTSTYDGVAIAWAVTEHVHDVLRARTIFATHYHELVELADVLPGVGAFNVAVRETGDDIVFLRRLEPGGCDRSYGVQVARLAGVPRGVIERARQILIELEEGFAGGTRLAPMADRERGQLSLFTQRSASRVEERLRLTDPDQLTPMEALALLAELRRVAQEDA